LASDRAVVAALVFVALALRAPNLGRAYWVDEGISLGIASHPLSQLPALLRQDGSPPLLYVVLHFWTRVFGTSEVATHFLPLIVSLTAVPLGYWAATEMFDRRAGLAAAALLATNPFLGWYSTETRMYPMVVVLSLVAVTLAWRAFRDRRRRDWVGAVLSFAALLYTHNWGIYLTAVTAAVLFGLAVSRGDRARAVWVVAGGAATVALWAPWIPSFFYQASNTAAPWAVRPAIGDFFADPSSALGGTLGIVIAPLLGIGALALRNRIPARDRSMAALLAAIALLATLAGFVGAQIEPSWTVRYLAIIVGPFLLAAAGALSPTLTGRRVVAAACVILSAWALIGLLLPNPNGRFAKSNVAAVALAAAPRLHPGDLVVVAQTEQTAVAYHYLPPGLGYLNPTGPVSDPSVVDWRNIVARLEAANPCLTIAPSIDALPVGARVLEINPARQLGANGTAWSRAVNGQVHAVNDFMSRDPALTPIAIYNPGLDPRPFSPVDGVLYVKTSTEAGCR
jgi:mannosyltransferase